MNNEYSLDVVFSINNGKVSISVNDNETGYGTDWKNEDIKDENLSKVCKQVGNEIMSWIQLRAEEN